MTEESTEVVLDSHEAPEVSIASAIIPFHLSDERARYLGYRACGMSVRESLQLVNRSKPTLSYWRLDPKFVEIENKLPEYRKQLSKEYVEIEFFRNFRLALEKDYRILTRTLNPPKDDSGYDIPMTKQDHDYLIKMRSQYSPQQLQVLEAIIAGTGGDFNFSKFIAENPHIVQMSRTDTVTVLGKDNGDGE